MTADAPGERLPPLLAAGRTGGLAALVGCGAATAAVAGVSAWATTHALSSGELVWLAALVGAALALGALRAAERVLGERLGQGYIHELRVRLVEAALSRSGSVSPGILIARTTNDLTAVRNWVSLGLAPLMNTIPLLAGVTAVLVAFHPLAAAAFALVVCALGALMLASARGMFERARAVRRARGRLASSIADTVGALETVRAAGGERRERRQVDRLGGRVADAAVHRSRLAGFARGAAAAAAALTTAAVVALGVAGIVASPSIPAILLVVGIATAPLQDVGRIVEYRQNFRAARRILVPALRVDAAPDPTLPAPTAADATLEVAGLVVDGEDVPRMAAGDRDRVLVTSEAPHRVRAVVDALAGASGGAVRVGAAPSASPTRRRDAIGICRGTDRLPRGSVDRAVRYRVPDSDRGEGDALLRRLGLDRAVAELPRGERTTLRRGGEPLAPADRVLVHVARAAFREPAVLVIDGVADRLDDDRLRRVRALVADHPGVVVSTDAALVEGQAMRTWCV
ncbi:MAG: ABC transporter transmembrane domain-containing protein [Microbacterium sp.]